MSDDQMDHPYVGPTPVPETPDERFTRLHPRAALVHTRKLIGGIVESRFFDRGTEFVRRQYPDGTVGWRRKAVRP